jgi:hypothetical protein
MALKRRALRPVSLATLGLLQTKKGSRKTGSLGRYLFGLRLEGEGHA